MAPFLSTVCKMCFRASALRSSTRTRRRENTFCKPSTGKAPLLLLLSSKSSDVTRGHYRLSWGRGIELRYWLYFAGIERLGMIRQRRTKLSIHYIITYQWQTELITSAKSLREYRSLGPIYSVRVLWLMV